MPNRPPTDGPYTVAIADDDVRVREALVGLLDDDARIELRGAFADGNGLCERCRAGDVDPAVIDVAMPGGGPELARAIHDISPDTVIAVYTAHHDRRTRAAMLAAGAAAILVKGATTDITAALLDVLTTARTADPSSA